MKNVTTFGKLLLLFCLPPPPMYKTTTRNELARLGMGTIFLVTYSNVGMAKLNVIVLNPPFENPGYGLLETGCSSTPRYTSFPHIHFTLVIVFLFMRKLTISPQSLPMIVTNPLLSMYQNYLAHARLSCKERAWSNCILLSCPRNPWHVNWFIYCSEVWLPAKGARESGARETTAVDKPIKMPRISWTA